MLWLNRVIFQRNQIALSAYITFLPVTGVALRKTRVSFYCVPYAPVLYVCESMYTVLHLVDPHDLHFKLGQNAKGKEFNLKNLSYTISARNTRNPDQNTFSFLPQTVTLSLLVAERRGAPYHVERR